MLCGPAQMVDVARAMDRAAKGVGVDFIGGFSALVEKGFTRGDHALSRPSRRCLR